MLKRLLSRFRERRERHAAALRARDSAWAAAALAEGDEPSPFHHEAEAALTAALRSAGYAVADRGTSVDPRMPTFVVEGGVADLPIRWEVWSHGASVWVIDATGVTVKRDGPEGGAVLEVYDHDTPSDFYAAFARAVVLCAQCNGRAQAAGENIVATGELR